MTDYDPTIAERNERFITSNEKMDLIRVQLWIPRKKRDSYHKSAAKDRAEHRKQLGLEK